MNTYLRFCLHFGLTPVPADQKTILAYTAFLSRGLNAASINAYINIVRLMHEASGFPNPMANNLDFNLLKRGIMREKAELPKQKLPITVHILKQFSDHIDYTVPSDVVCWAATLIGFYGFLRKSSLVAKSSSSPGPSCIKIQDVIIENADTFWIIVKHSKTIQFHQRQVRIPFTAVSDSTLCPVSALQRLIPLLPPDTTQPLFSYLAGQTIVYVTHSKFVSFIKNLVARIGLDPTVYSGHSLRRGGATYAFNVGLPAHIIKLRGDWRSNAFEQYISLHDPMNLLASKVLSNSMLNS
jgi:hypothetical protein